MRTVYIVEGLGFGDDENVWERCSTYSTWAAADAERTRMLEDAVDDEWEIEVRICEEQVQE